MWNLLTVIKYRVNSLVCNEDLLSILSLNFLSNCIVGVVTIVPPEDVSDIDDYVIYFGFFDNINNEYKSVSESSRTVDSFFTLGSF